MNASACRRPPRPARGPGASTSRRPGTAPSGPRWAAGRRARGTAPRSARDGDALVRGGRGEAGVAGRGRRCAPRRVDLGDQHRRPPAGSRRGTPRPRPPASPARARARRRAPNPRSQLADVGALRLERHAQDLRPARAALAAARATTVPVVASCASTPGRSARRRRSSPPARRATRAGSTQRRRPRVQVRAVRLVQPVVPARARPAPGRRARGRARAARVRPTLCTASAIGTCGGQRRARLAGAHGLARARRAPPRARPGRRSASTAPSDAGDEAAVQRGGDVVRVALELRRERAAASASSSNIESAAISPAT